MIGRKFCILKKKKRVVVFHYLTLLVHCEKIDAYINKLYLFLNAHIGNIFWRKFYDIYGGADFGPYSPQSFDQFLEDNFVTRRAIPETLNDDNCYHCTCIKIFTILSRARVAQWVR